MIPLLQDSTKYDVPSKSPYVLYHSYFLHVANKGCRNKNYALGSRVHTIRVIFSIALRTSLNRERGNRNDKRYQNSI